MVPKKKHIYYGLHESFLFTFYRFIVILEKYTSIELVLGFLSIYFYTILYNKNNSRKSIIIKN
jgi:succinate-acetate transporter protein